MHPFPTFAFLVLSSSTLLASDGSGTDSSPRHLPGAVYTMSNDPMGNTVLVLGRSSDGLLSTRGEVTTGGVGTGSPLGNQGGVVMSDDHRWLLVVNPGSDDVSLFGLREDASPVLLDVVDSGGLKPISVTIHGSQVYVLNAGGTVGAADNVVGFDLTPSGRLVQMPGSTHLLSAVSTDPAQVGFSPNGRMLVVTEKATNLLDVIVLSENGTPTGARTFPSTGVLPFGFAFGARGSLFVSEASGGAPSQGALSSYSLTRAGALLPIDSVSTTETATCWVVVTPGTRRAYVTNTGSNTVTGLAIGAEGHLELLDPDGETGATGSMPIDMDLSADGRFLYTLDAGAGGISAFRVRADGSLMALPGLDVGLGRNGLAAR